MDAMPDLRLVRDGELYVPYQNDLLSKVTILGEREGGLVDAMVPVELIHREDVPVDREHVAELKASIVAEAAKGLGTGQLTPVLLGEVPRRDDFLIIDGFHRDAAFFDLGECEIYSTIRRGSSLEEVLDLRILTATSHASVNFARVVEWIGDAWTRTPWSEKLTVVQAFSLTKTASSGKVLGLSPAQAEEVKAWVNDKCDKWGLSPTTVHVNLTTAELADPELVKEARRRVGGHSLVDITPQHLGVIARGFPRQYALQRLVADIAKQHNMNIPSTRAVVEVIKKAGTWEEAQELAASTHWTKIEPEYSASRARELARAAKLSSEAAAAVIDDTETASYTGLVRKFAMAEITLSRLALETSVLKGQYMPPSLEVARKSVFKVDTTEDPELGELVKPNGDSTTIDNFYMFAEKATPNITSMLIGKHGLDEKQANDVVRAASFRIVTDINEGDLRLVDVGREVVFHEMMVGCIRDELNRRRLNHTALKLSPNGANPLELPTIPVADLVGALPRMNDVVRRILFMHGLLGISLATTAKLIGKRPTDLPIFIDDGFGAIEEANTRRDRNLLKKIVT